MGGAPGAGMVAAGAILCPGNVFGVRQAAIVQSSEIAEVRWQKHYFKLFQTNDTSARMESFVSRSLALVRRGASVNCHD